MLEFVRLKSSTPLFQVRRPRHARNRQAARVTLLSLAVCLLLAPEPTPRRARLAASLGPVRCVEGRITGGFLHAEFVPGGKPDWTRRQIKALRGFKREIEPDARPGRSAGPHRSAAPGDPGLAHLLAGHTTEALTAWQEVYREDWLDAELGSDLAALHLAAEGPGRSMEVARGLALSNHALRLAPRLPEARFNRALALEKLFLRDEARQAWRDYLELDRSSGWAREARRRLRHLEQPTRAEQWPAARTELERAAGRGEAAAVRRIVADFPQFARELGEEKLLTKWAQLLVAEQEQLAREVLQVLRGLGSALAETNGERMLADAVAAIDEARADPDPTRLAALVEGHALFASVHSRILGHETGAAWPDLQRMRTALARGRTPFRHWVGLLAAMGHIDRGDSTAARAELRRLRTEAEPDRYGSLDGRIAWIQGILAIRGAEPAEALAAYGHALACFDRNRERGNQASVRGLLADAWRYLGEPARAWELRSAALAELGEISHPRRLRPLADETARALAADGRPDVALYFQGLGIRAAHAQGDLPAVASFLQRRALLRHQLGDSEGSRDDLREAERTAARITGPTRGMIRADLLRIRVQIEGLAGRETEQRLDRTIETYENAQGRIFLAGLYLSRGRVRLARGNLDAAEHDFEAAVREYEDPRSRTPADFRVPYFDQAQEAFEEAIALQLERGRPDAALQYSERSRARTLADRQGGAAGAGSLVRADEIPRRLPAGSALIELSVLADRVVAWVVRREGIGAAVELPVSREELEAQATLLHQEIARRETDLPAARGLFDMIAPALRERVRPGDTLIFVPDERLHSVPFAALQDPATGRYLIQDHAIVIAPSAASYLLALARFRALAGAGALPKALLIGDPTFQRAAFPDLPRLPDARLEVEALARLYPGATVLLEKQASKDRTLAELGRHDIVHIASHAVAHPEFPPLSRFALAPGADDGSLTAHELGRVSLPRTRLAVLSACRTGDDGHIGSEGVSSLVWPFLAAGVPAVVASLWDVNDSATAALMTAFHARLLAGNDPWSALRAAQLQSLDGGAPAAVWAAFQVYGGGDVRASSNASP